MPILKIGDDATGAFRSIVLIGIFVLSARLLLWTDKFHSGLLYIAIPFGISLALYYLTPYTDGATWARRFWNNMRTTMIILFASSLFLMEGYVCVIMFLPIYFFFTLIAFLAAYIRQRLGKDSVHSHVLPAVVLLMALEGATETTSFERRNVVTYSDVINSSMHTVKQRLAEPIKLDGNRHWILAVFPKPRSGGTVPLAEGSVRRYEFVYHRWFIANTHKGNLDVYFTEVSENHVKTTIEDSSYISNYMRVLGTCFTFEPINSEQTRVTLSVTFDRLLDPLWYFEPLERFAVEKGAEYFVQQVLGKNTENGEGEKHA